MNNTYHHHNTDLTSKSLCSIWSPESPLKLYWRTVPVIHILQDALGYPWDVTHNYHLWTELYLCMLCLPIGRSLLSINGILTKTGVWSSLMGQDLQNQDHLWLLIVPLYLKQDHPYKKQCRELGLHQDQEM